MARDLFEDFHDEDLLVTRLTERQAELIASIRCKLASVDRDVRAMKRSLHAALIVRHEHRLSESVRNA